MLRQTGAVTPTGRILVVGGDGLVGAGLTRHLTAAGVEVVATTRRRDGPLFLDVAAAADSVPALPRVDAAVLCAGVARLADCDRDPDGSRRVNVDGIIGVASALVRQGAYVLHLSSDKVFDGQVAQRRRDEPTCPLTRYGEQKAAAEAGVLSLAGEVGVLRLSKVLAPSLPLLNDWATSLRAGVPIAPFTDMYLAPISLDLVCDLIARLLQARAAGIYQCSGAADHSYVELAKCLAQCFSADPDLIAPCRSGLYPSALSPNTTLDMSVESARFGTGQPVFEAVIADIAASLP